MRRYFHARVVFKDGKCVCDECGAEVDEMLTSSSPCVVKTTALTVINNLPVMISVYNCQAFLVAEIPTGWASWRVIAFEESEEIADELASLLERDIYEQGGGLNMSGYYSLSTETAVKVAKWLEEGKLRLAL